MSGFKKFDETYIVKPSPVLTDRVWGLDSEDFNPSSRNKGIILQAIADLFKNSMGLIGTFYHNDDGDAERPDFPVVHWYGTVEPLNAINGDIWYDLS